MEYVECQRLSRESTRPKTMRMAQDDLDDINRVPEETHIMLCACACAKMTMVALPFPPLWRKTMDVVVAAQTINVRSAGTNHSDLHSSRVFFYFFFTEVYVRALASVAKERERKMDNKFATINTAKQNKTHCFRLSLDTLRTTNCVCIFAYDYCVYLFWAACRKGAGSDSLFIIITFFRQRSPIQDNNNNDHNTLHSNCNNAR